MPQKISAIPKSTSGTEIVASTTPPRQGMHTAKEIHDAAQDGRLSQISPESVIKWIRAALDSEDLESKIAFTKERILQYAPKIKDEKSQFTPAEIAPYFHSFMNGCTVSVLTAALFELHEEGRIAALDPGRAPVYSFC